MNWAEQMKKKQRANELDLYEQKILSELEGWTEYLEYSSLLTHRLE